MPSIVIRLDPALLPNPDTDLRYDIPDRLQLDTNGLVQDAGYDYEAGTDAMLIFLTTADLDSALAAVLTLLQEVRLHDNILAQAATVGVADEELRDVREFAVVYPEGSNGVIPVSR